FGATPKTGGTKLNWQSPANKAFPNQTLVTSSAPKNTTYINELLIKAEEKDLHKSRAWEVMLHYKPSSFLNKNATDAPVESLVDDPLFFLSKSGKTNPWSELSAMIDASFEDASLGDEHAQCRFIGRFTWLKKALDIDPKELPAVECKAFDEKMAEMKPRSAVLVFSDAHVNSPASMFGHTLLRIDSVRESKLLSHAANYSADATDTNGLIYTYKGLAGYYKGYFSILPYYEKVKEYSNNDQRDMWEYHLDFSKEEVMRIMMHLWEIKNLFTYYYFFDENCSYTLLFLLENARPSLRLTEQFNLSAIPVDTLRSVKESGIITKTVYRPSLATTINSLAKGLSSKELKTVKNITSGKIKPKDVVADKTLTEDALITTLDLSAEFLQYQYSKKKVLKEDYTPRFLSTLRARGALGKKRSKLYDVTPPTDPILGHPVKKFSIGIGAKNNLAFTELKFRPAYHELLDPPEGFIKGSQIKVYSLDLRIYPERNRVKINEVNLINILSLTPRGKFFKPLSWKINSGFKQRNFLKLDSDGKRSLDDHMIYGLNAGAALVYDTLIGMPYIMAEADLVLGKRFDENHSLAVGTTLGVITQVTKKWKSHILVRALFYELGENHEAFEGTLKQSFSFDRKTSLLLEVKRERIFELYSTEAALSLNLYF
ncbi:MAG: DUF4105 domain-containing protein, partial [Deltaproteobacteria bacterium]|nr:DUF4105 domain-containing protein [Deltaproteobacteria bacterium]